jgi:hypothetical protein
VLTVTLARSILAVSYLQAFDPRVSHFNQLAAPVAATALAAATAGRCQREA